MTATILPVRPTALGVRSDGRWRIIFANPFENVARTRPIYPTREAAAVAAFVGLRLGGWNLDRIAELLDTTLVAEEGRSSDAVHEAWVVNDADEFGPSAYVWKDSELDVNMAFSDSLAGLGGDTAGVRW